MKLDYFLILSVWVFVLIKAFVLFLILQLYSSIAVGYLCF